MKVFLRPTGLHSLAMQRVANALERYAPMGVEIVKSAGEADLQLLHVIGETEPPVDREYAVIQYCGSKVPGLFQELWKGARLVWSYYDLREVLPEGSAFMLAPLGIDDAFLDDKWRTPDARRELQLMTSGYSTGPLQEAIQEAAEAAIPFGKVCHLGPNTIEGWDGPMPPANDWVAMHNVSDPVLAQLYRNCRWVSGLRHVEAFEMPVIEGASCGARPVVFDRPEMRYWFGAFAEFVPECGGPELVSRLSELFAAGPKPLSELEIAEVRARFDWRAIAELFWKAVLSRATRRPAVTLGETKRRLLWIGDAVASTGFAKGTHNACEALRKKFDVHVLGINYHGDPHDLPYPVYPAIAGGDFMGLGRVKALVESLGPSVVVLQNDPWHVQDYLKLVGDVPTVGYIAVDGKNCAGTELNGLAKAVFWTEFAETEARIGGYRGPSAVVPLGVDLDLYRPQDPLEARDRSGFARVLAARGLPRDTFVVGVVGRNQWRKRLDLTLQYFAEWVHGEGITDACLWVHSAPTGDDAWDLRRLAKYYRIAERLILPEVPRTLKGAPEASMADTYAKFDCLFSTTMGEGFGLPMLEAAACGVPLVLPNWSGLGELFKDAAMLVPCTSTAAHPNQTCTIGGIMDREMAASALGSVYRDKELRAKLSQRALDRAREPRFRWREMGAAMMREVEETLAGVAVGV